MEPFSTAFDHTLTFRSKLAKVRGKDRGRDDCTGHGGECRDHVIDSSLILNLHIPLSFPLRFVQMFAKSFIVALLASAAALSAAQNLDNRQRALPSFISHTHTTLTSRK